MLKNVFRVYDKFSMLKNMLSKNTLNELFQIYTSILSFRFLVNRFFDQMSPKPTMLQKKYREDMHPLKYFDI